MTAPAHIWQQRGGDRRRGGVDGAHPAAARARRHQGSCSASATASISTRAAPALVTRAGAQRRRRRRPGPGRAAGHAMTTRSSLGWARCRPLGSASRSYNGSRAGGAEVGPIRSFDAHALPVQVAGDLEVWRIERAWLRAPGRSGRGRGGARPLSAGQRLVRPQGGLRPAARPPPGSVAHGRRRALVIALGLEQAFLEDFGPVFGPAGVDWSCAVQGRSGPIRFRSEVGLCATLLCDVLNLNGSAIVNASACAAGGMAIAQAASLKERGATSGLQCGGADSMDAQPFWAGRHGAPRSAVAPPCAGRSAGPSTGTATA